MYALTIKVSKDEEEIILRRMKASGETNRSGHIRRVYFENDGGGEELLGGMKHQLDLLADATMRNQRLLEQMIGIRTDTVDTTMLAALFMLLYPSVTPAVQATVDQYIDVGAIELFLKKGK